MISERAINAGLKELEIFDHFQIDDTLPKHHVDNKDTKLIDNSVPIDNWSGSISVGGNDGRFWNAVDGFNDNHGFMAHSVPSVLKWNAFFKRLWSLIMLWFKKKSYYNNILDFFMNFDGKVQDLKVVEELADHYENVLKKAKETGQKALVENILDLKEVYKYETLLFAKRITKFVTEEQVCDFFMKKAGAQKALKLTWIKNFTRIIPSDIIELKKEVDLLRIFDNYVILHYDKKGTGSKMTKKEKEIKKDPILFGVIKKSRKLYYIADWKDEVCDLTLNKMFEELGENVLKINNKSVKTYMDTGSDERRRSFKRK